MSFRYGEAAILKSGIRAADSLVPYPMQVTAALPPAPSVGRTSAILKMIATVWTLVTAAPVWHGPTAASGLACTPGT